MKKLEIRDDDDDLFNISFDVTIYKIYREYKKDVKRLVQKQSKGFWIQFVTSFHSFIKKNVLLDDYAERENQAEDAFINMLNILTIRNRFAEFAPLVESLKKIDIVTALMNETFFISARTFRLSDFQHPPSTFELYSRFVSAVVVLYIRSVAASRVRERTPRARWDPPANWYQNINGPCKYEKYMWEKWGNTLYELVSVNREKILLFEKRENPSKSASTSQHKKNNGTMSSESLNEEKKIRTIDVGNTSNGNNSKRRRRRRRRNDIKMHTDVPIKNVPSNTEKSDSANENEKTDSSFTIANTAQSLANGECSIVKTSCEAGASASRKEYNKGHEYSRPSSRENKENKETCAYTREKKSSKTCKVTENEKSETFNYSKMFSFGSDTKQNERNKEDRAVTGAKISNEKCKITEKNAKTDEDSTKQSSNLKEKPFKQNKSVNNDRKKVNSKNTDFRYDRLFSFGGKNETTNEETKGGRKDSKVKSCASNSGNETRQTCSSNGPKSNGSFKYDRLFKFSKKEEESTKNVKNNDSFKYDRMFKFSTEEKESTKNAKSNNFFKYDRMFKFSTKEEESTKNAKSKDSSKYDRVFKKEEESTSSQKSNHSFRANDNFWDGDEDVPIWGEDKDEPIFEDIFTELFRRNFMGQQHRKRTPVQPVRKFLLQKCSKCNILEKKIGSYSECKHCTEESVQNPKVYCSNFCKRNHWEGGHSNFHFGKKFKE